VKYRSENTNHEERMMDRIALSKRIGGLADVFANDSQMRNELLAMSRALELMPDEKFATLLGEGFDADEAQAAQLGGGFGVQMSAPKGPATVGRQHVDPAFEPRNPQQQLALMSDPKKAHAVMQALLTKPEVQKLLQDPKIQGILKSASEEEETVSDEATPEREGTVNSWSREATDAVIRNLVGDVLGKEAMDKVQCCDTNAHLTKEQTPDGEKKAEKPSTLKPEQTPDVAEALDTDMYSKSKGEVRKEASKEAAEEPKQSEAAEAEEPKQAEAGEAEEVAEEAVVEEPAPKKDEAEPTKAQEQKEERKEEKAEKKEEEATKGAEQAAKALEELGEMKKEASDRSESSMVFKGIELTAPMADVELTKDDVDTLGKLFQ